MKIILVGCYDKDAYSDPFRLKGFEEAGFDALEFDFRSCMAIQDKDTMNETLVNTASIFRPDIVFINNGSFVDPGLLSKLKSKMIPEFMLVTWLGDVRGKDKMFDQILELGRLSDYLGISNSEPELWDLYKKNGVKNMFEHHCAADVDTFKRHTVYPEKFSCDIVFAGGHYPDLFPLSDLRRDCVIEASRKFKVKVYGARWDKTDLDIGSICGGAFRDRLAVAASAAKIQLCVNAYNDMFRYTSNRTWNALATGRMVLQDSFSGCEELLGEHGENVIFFSGVDDMMEKAEYYLSHDQEREEIAARGREFVKHNHTYYHRALEIKSLYNKWVTNDSY